MTILSLRLEEDGDLPCVTVDMVIRVENRGGKKA